jgi:hypothetical protein
MKNEREFLATALATTFIVRELLPVLVGKGILSKSECRDLMDRSLLNLEERQNQDFPENAPIWDTARKFVSHLIVHDYRQEDVSPIEAACASSIMGSSR